MASFATSLIPNANVELRKFVKRAFVEINPYCVTPQFMVGAHDDQEFDETDVMDTGTDDENTMMASDLTASSMTVLEDDKMSGCQCIQCCRDREISSSRKLIQGHKFYKTNEQTIKLWFSRMPIEIREMIIGKTLPAQIILQFMPHTQATRILCSISKEDSYLSRLVFNYKIGKWVDVESNYYFGYGFDDRDLIYWKNMLSNYMPIYDCRRKTISPLCVAARVGNEAAVDHLLKDPTTWKGVPTLACAIVGGNVSIVKKILGAFTFGGKPAQKYQFEDDLHPNNIIFVFGKFGTFDIFKLVVESLKIPQNSIVTKLCPFIENRLQELDWIISLGIDNVTKHDIIFHAFISDSSKCFELLMNRYKWFDDQLDLTLFQINPLRNSRSAKIREQYAFLIKSTYNILCYEASVRGAVNIFRALYNGDFTTTLHIALIAGHYKIYNTLVDLAGPDFILTDDVLYLLSKYNQQNIITLLTKRVGSTIK